MIAIFSFEIGDYLRDEKKNLLVFETQGLLNIFKNGITSPYQ